MLRHLSHKQQSKQKVRHNKTFTVIICNYIIENNKMLQKRFDIELIFLHSSNVVLKKCTQLYHK